MRVRRNIWPNSIQDAFITSFLMIIIPFVFYFEIFIVLPYFHRIWSPIYILHFVNGTFILWNVCSNMVAIILCDTSIRGILLPTKLAAKWKFCSVCECVVPPRSWHCEICNICILKRDHHCKFTSCCIGHGNHRYFFVFVFYMFIGTLYSSWYNLSFVYYVVNFDTLSSLLKIIFPVAAFFVFFTYKELYLAATLLTVFGTAFSFVLLFFHVKLMLKNKTTHEKKASYKLYNYGKMENIINVLGERWYLVWLSPLIDSKLPQDGVNWKFVETSKIK